MTEGNEGGVRVERPVGRCDQCRFWLRLVDTKESYGLCLWYTQRPAEQVIPQWLKGMVQKYAQNNPYGSLPPNSGSTCDAFLKHPTDA